MVKWVNVLSEFGLMEACNRMLLVLKDQGFISALLVLGLPFQVFRPITLYPFFFKRLEGSIEIILYEENSVTGPQRCFLRIQCGIRLVVILY